MDKTELKYLLSLLDDDDAIVRQEILSAFTRYGLRLESDIAKFDAAINNYSRSLLAPILKENRKKWLSVNWYALNFIDDADTRLESALNFVDKFLYGLSVDKSASDYLDIISESFRSKFVNGDEFDLAFYLFKEYGIEGCTEDYYNPFNSSIRFALEERKGLPITLALIYMLTAKRLGLKVEGCNFPGHFLAKIFVDNKPVLIDCYNKGKILYNSDIRKLVGDESFDSVLSLVHNQVDADVIIKRIAANLANAYSHVNDRETSDFFQSLQKTA